MILLLALLAMQAPAAAAPAGSPEAFFATRIRPVLEANCFECHGPRKQKSGLRLDSREAVLRGGHGPIVVPGDPDKSRLIDAIGYEDGELQMPPDGKLPAQSIADLTEWVRMGVPWGDAAAANPNDPAKAADSPKPNNPPSPLAIVAGRFHPILVHFPIALILAAAVAEGLAIAAAGEARRVFRGAALYCLFVGVAGAVASAASGWVHLANGPYAAASGAAVVAELHRWLGVSTAAFGSLVSAAALVAARRPTRAANATYRAGLFALAAAVGATAHFGGLLTHGLDFFGA
jgi:uncharacterized membrane protein